MLRSSLYSITLDIFYFYFGPLGLEEISKFSMSRKHESVKEVLGHSMFRRSLGL